VKDEVEQRMIQWEKRRVADVKRQEMVCVIERSEREKKRLKIIKGNLVSREIQVSQCGSSSSELLCFRRKPSLPLITLCTEEADKSRQKLMLQTLVNLHQSCSSF
jgi:hypothetical protein